GRRIVGFSVPIWSGSADEPQRHVLGVLTMTVELGRFAELRPEEGSSNHQVAVLVDARQDDRLQRGSILEHPHLSDQVQRQERPDAVYLAEPELELVDELRADAALRANGVRSHAQHASALL